MRNKSLALTLLAIAAFAGGCDQHPQTTSQQLDTVKAETKQDAQDLKDYTYAQKDDFVKQMQIQLAALNQDLDKLGAKIESSSDSVKAEARPKLQALRDQAAQLNKQLGDVGNSTETTWDSVKAGSQKAWDALKDGVNQSRQWVSDKIAP
jgi:cytochrome c556